MSKPQASLLANSCLAIFAMLASGLAIAQNAAEEVTYTQHVAAIMQDKCQICHQPNSVAPMSFLTYEEVRPWAPLIKMRVEARKCRPGI